MKISQIMRTNVGPERLPHSICGALEIGGLGGTVLATDAPYEVTDEAGHKVGEVDGERLAYLVNSVGAMRLDRILNSIKDGVVVIDKDGRVCFQNVAYSRIIGVPMRKTIGKNLYRIEPDALLLKVLELGQPSSRERQLIKSVQKYVSMQMYPILDGTQVVGAYSIFRDVTELNHLNQEVQRITGLAEELGSQLDAQLSKLEIISRSPTFKNLISQAVTAAKTDATVLICGENGVGKEVFTKLIHQNSYRKEKPFITVNCAAIPENLIESELFGYEEGAFTGARKGGKPGKFELAQGGTLFLDEIGDMPILMQTKLLRALQEGEIEKIGRGDSIPVDVRVIAATNQPLEELIAQKKFRQDLYYRLNVISFTIPGLRQRREDIAPLASHFLAHFNEKYGKNATISPDAYEMLLCHDWPGNVRQLQNCIESAVIMCSDGAIGVEALAGRLSARTDTPTPHATVPNRTYKALGEEVAQYERQVLTDVLAQCGGDRSEAAKRLGISRRTLYRKLEER